jgi:hypothetical protein
LGRNVVVSGVEFEPALPTPSPPVVRSSNVLQPSFFGSWDRDEEEKVPPPPTPTKEEMMGFFQGGASRVVEKERGEHTQDEGGHSASESADQTSESGWLATAGKDERGEAVFVLSRQRAGELTPVPDVPPSMALTLVEEEERGGDEDTQEAREARWASVIEDAEKRASSMPIEEEHEREHEYQDQTREEASSPFTSEPIIEEEPSIEAESTTEDRPLLPSADAPPSRPVAASPGRESTVLYRLGLGTVGSSYSLAGVGRSVSTISSSPSRVVAAKGKGKGLVQDWILRGNSVDLATTAPSYHIDVSPRLRRRRSAPDRSCFTVRSRMAQ